MQNLQTKPTKPNQTYQTKPKLPHQTYLKKSTEPNLPNKSNEALKIKCNYAYQAH